MNIIFYVIMLLLSFNNGDPNLFFLLKLFEITKYILLW